MPSRMLAMGVSPTTFILERRNAKVKPSFIMVDNALGAQDAVLTFTDTFTPSPSNGAPLPVPTTQNRLGINVTQLACVSIEDLLKDIEFYGVVAVTIATPDAGCRITIGWDYV